MALRDSDDQIVKLRTTTKAQLALGTASVAIGVLIFSLVFIQTIIEDVTGDDSSGGSKSLCIPNANQSSLWTFQI